MQAVEKLSRTLGFLGIALGAIVGSAVWSALRTWTYILEGRQPNMGPELFVLFSPVLAIPIALAAGIGHVLAHKYFAYRHWWQWVVAGLMYSTVLLGLVSPWLLLIPAVINPITLRAVTDRGS